MTITVYYWGPAGGMNMYGRAIGIYATLKAAGVSYVEAGPNARPELSSFAPPAVDLGDGVVVGQAPACLTALGEKFNLGGATFAEKARVQQDRALSLEYAAPHRICISQLPTHAAGNARL